MSKNLLYLNSDVNASKSTMFRNRPEFDTSRRSMSSDLQYSGINFAKHHDDTSAFVDRQSNSSSMLDINSETVLEKQNTVIKSKTDALFPQFLEVLQGRTNSSEIFDTIQDLVHICGGVLSEIEKGLWQASLKSKMKRQLEYADWLKLEMKTWKLLYVLYKDRILLQGGTNSSMEYEGSCLAGSEKEIITQLYTTNATLREYQLIVDWLEACFEKSDNDIEIGHSTDCTVAWENTLFHLTNEQRTAFSKAGAEIVQSLDPDAPVREKRPLHALDEEDDARLAQCIFFAIRQGHVDEAMALCKYCGQTWRAALLEGWRLHEDPNYDHILPHAQQTNCEKLPIEGNPRRDVWKKCAWMLADSKKHDDYSRAIAGAFCGHLSSLKAVLSNSWEDLLWAYLKVQIDIRVESELRICCIKSYLQMPEAYWNSKMSLEQILDELLVHNDAAVRDYAMSKVGIIQKYLILDNVGELLKQMQQWTVEKSTDSKNELLIKPHLLRFLTHIVLFLRQIGRVEKEETADAIIAAYVETLINMKDAQLVAFYSSALPRKMQIELYSKFMENIDDSSIRSTALEEALKCGLDIESITRSTVRKIREMTSPGDGEPELQIGEISKIDERKIHALEYLTFIPTQRGDLLWEANALIRSFLEAGKSDCVRAAFEMIPADTINHLLNTYGSNDNFPCREECAVKEYLSYKVYLTAIECFNEWSHLHHNKPKQPELVGADANFTERIASEHKQSAYLAELNRWKLTLEEQTKVSRDSLFNVIVFPERGWLVDADTNKSDANVTTVEWVHRQHQLEKLRTICIPEIVLLLYKLLHTTGDHQNCMKLADDIASETGKLYTVYTKHKLAQLLAKLAESSLEMLNNQCDPWGFPSVV